MVAELRSGPTNAKPSLARRGVARIAVPVTLVGMLTTGAAVAAWPEASAQPAAGGVASGPVAASVAETPAHRNGPSPAASAKRPSKANTTTKAAAKSGLGSKDAASKPAAREPGADKATAKKVAAAFRPSERQLRIAGHRYTRAPLNVRTQPSSSARLVDVVQTRSRLAVTRVERGAWRLVVHRGKPRWVHGRYLVVTKPKAPTAAVESKQDSSPARPSFGNALAGNSSTSSARVSSVGLSMKRCRSGSAMERGLKRDAIRVHRALCARFPQIKSYGGRRSGGGSFHGSGRAVDAMISGSTGWRVAKWVRANRKRLGVSEVIYAQRIWTVQRNREGWRKMSSRGSRTANHHDHVHISVYGNRGTG